MLMENQNADSPDSMAGLETHEKVFRLVKKFVKKPTEFLDLGAGQGAFSRKLKDLGHKVVAVDSHPENWKAPDIQLVKANLDGQFAENIQTVQAKFGAVVAIEIIEHIENPFSFAREAAKLLNKGGLLFLTTPNVEAVNSRLIFLYTGRLKHFGAYETVRPAHITPIFRWKLEMLLEEAGFEIIDESFNRIIYQTGTNLKGRIAAYIVRFLSPVLKGEKGGECRIIVAKLK